MSQVYCIRKENDPTNMIKTTKKVVLDIKYIKFALSWNATS
jgi:hypothetical protein